MAARPKTAASRPTTAASRPTTAASRPATAASRSSRPATAASRASRTTSKGVETEADDDGVGEGEDEDKEEGQGERISYFEDDCMIKLLEQTLQGIGVLAAEEEPGSLPAQSSLSDSLHALRDAMVPGGDQLRLAKESAKQAYMASISK